MFECAYGRLPKTLLYLGLPFLTLLSIGLFVATVWFDVSFSLRNLPIPPALVAFGVSPVLLLLVIGSCYVEVNQRRYPRRVVVREDGILVPKGRVKTGEMLLGWKGMTAKVTSMGFMTEVSLKNSAGDATRLNLMMFSTQDDFEALLEVLEDYAEFQ